MCHTIDMRIHSEGGLSEGDALDDIRRLPAYTREIEKQVHV
jgi:hypothetical protein